MRYILFLCLACFAVAQTGPLVPRRVIQCETSNISAQALPLIFGETIDLEVRLTAYTKALDITGSTVLLHARTNGMAEGYSWQIAGEPRDGGLAAVRIDTSSWLPPGFRQGEWRLEVIQPGNASVLRAGGQLSMLGTGVGSASAPMPSPIVHELWDAIGVLQASTNVWDQAVSWGDHAGLYYPLSGGNLDQGATISILSAPSPFGTSKLTISPQQFFFSAPGISTRLHLPAAPGVQIEGTIATREDISTAIEPLATTNFIAAVVEPLATTGYVHNAIHTYTAPTLVRDGVAYRQYWDTNLLTTAWEPIND